MRLIDDSELRKLYTENKTSKARCDAVLQDRINNVNYYEGVSTRHGLYRELMADDMTDGFLMGYPHGSVIKQGTRSSYYRGENQIYPTCLPTLLRKINSLVDEEDKKLEKILGDMRVYEFKQLLYLFQHVQNWEQRYGTVLFEPLAQHYGISTKWLDVTSDFEVALFFACCFYDENAGKWKPLTQNETEISEETKYGVIFQQPRWKVINKQMARYSSYSRDQHINYNDLVLPIGFQPFMRCHMQSGYGIYSAQDLYQGQDFEPLKFRHNEKLSKFIYREMDGGRKIYPHEGLNAVNDQINLIKTARCFSAEAFRYATMNNEIKEPSNTKKALKNRGYQIGQSPIKLSRQRRRAIDRVYSDFSIEDDYGITIRFRMVKS